MNKDYQIDTLRSFSSSSSQDDSKKIIKQSPINLDQNQISDSIYGNYNTNLKPIVVKANARKSSGSSDWNETQEVEVDASNKKKNVNASVGKGNQNKSKQKSSETNKNVKYPDLKYSSSQKPQSQNKLSTSKTQEPQKRQQPEPQPQKKLEPQKRQQPEPLSKKKSEPEQQWSKKADIKKYPQITINTSQYSDQQQQQIDVTASMIGERRGKNEKVNKKQQAKQQKQQKQQKSQSIIKMKKINKQQDDKGSINPFQSVYMSGPKGLDVRKDVTFKVMDNIMYWIYKDKELKISTDTIQALIQHFLKNDILLPLIHQQQLASNHVQSYMLVYTEFLNSCFHQLFTTIFLQLKSAIQSKVSLGLTSPTTPRSSQKNLMQNLYEKYVPTIFKTNYSKPELLRDHLIKKLKMLKLMSKLNQRNKTESEHQNEILLIFEDKQKTILHQIGILELLVSFENSENYCKNESTQGIDHRIWKQHSKKISELRKRWISNIEENEKDFAFLI